MLGRILVNVAIDGFETRGVTLSGLAWMMAVNQQLNPVADFSEPESWTAIWGDSQ